MARLPLRDSTDAQVAWRDIELAIGRFNTVRLSEIEVRPKPVDSADLNQLAALADPEKLLASLQSLDDQFEKLVDDNPALHMRLRGSQAFRGKGPLTNAFTEVQDQVHALTRRIHLAVEEIRLEMDNEDGRGRAQNPDSDFQLADDLLRIWLEFTPEGTSAGRSSDYAKTAGAFHAFVEAAGKVIDPDFSGTAATRRAWEQWKNGGQDDHESR